MRDWETQLITVVAVDIRNFTHHSLRRDHENEDEYLGRFAKLCDQTRDFHDLTNATVQRHDPQGAALLISTGDGLIIGFRSERHAAEAFAAVRELLQTYTEFFLRANAELEERRYSTALGYGIGLHTGRIMVRAWQPYTMPGSQQPIILGDAVNIATRLEKQTRDHPGCGAMYSEDAREAVTAQGGGELLQGSIDYQFHDIRGYRPLHLYGLRAPGWRV